MRVHGTGRGMAQHFHTSHITKSTPKTAYTPYTQNTDISPTTDGHPSSDSETISILRCHCDSPRPEAKGLHCLFPRRLFPSFWASLSLCICLSLQYQVVSLCARSTCHLRNGRGRGTKDTVYSWHGMRWRNDLQTGCGALAAVSPEHFSLPSTWPLLRHLPSVMLAKSGNMYCTRRLLGHRFCNCPG